MKKSQSSDYFNSLMQTLGVDKEGILTLKPTAEYRFASGKLRKYGTFEGNKDILILGLEDDEGNYNCVGLGDFYLENGQVSSFAITGFDFNNDNILYFSLNNDGTIDASMYAIDTDTQSKLHTHTLTLTADKSYILTYQSTTESSVNSIGELRNLMYVRSTSDNVILPVCATDLSSTAVLQVTTTLCKIGTANVTTVSDKVTDL